LAQTRSSPNLIQDLQQGGMSAAAALFADAGAPAPLLIWSPHVHLTEHRLIDRFADICDSLAPAGGPIPIGKVDLNRFGAMQEWLMQLMRAPSGELVYRHYGSGIARAYGQDMTGASTHDFPGHIGTFFTALYEAAAHRCERVLSVHQPPAQVFVSTWRRLIVPLVDDNAERVCGFLALNYPENELRAGLEVVPIPVLIMDRTHVVRFANKVARETFDSGSFGPWNRSVFDYAGLDLEIEDSPDAVLRSGFSRSRATRHFTHQAVGRYDAVISATTHHGTAFYVVLLNSGSG
jgi:PAS domain-containing protein